MVPEGTREEGVYNEMAPEGIERGGAGIKENGP